MTSQLAASSPTPETESTGTLKITVTAMLVITALCSVLIPILIALFVFSATSSRRLPVFWINVTAILLGLAEGGIFIYGGVHSILTPDIPLLRVVFAIPAFTTLVPLTAEIALIMRVLAVYPLSVTPRAKLAAILSPTIFLKILRIAFAILFLVKCSAMAQRALFFNTDAAALWGSWEPKAVWMLESVDNAYISTIFLRRLRMRGIAVERIIRPRRMVSRMRTLFYMALSSFVFPVVLDIVQFALSFYTGLFYQSSLVLVINGYVTIISVVFATLWASASRELDEKDHCQTITLSAVYSPSTSSSNSQIPDLHERQDWEPAPKVTLELAREV